MNPCLSIQLHDDLDWSAVVKQAKTLDIAVFYYDKWIRSHEDAFKTFFTAGGTARLIMSDARESLIRSTMQHVFFPDKSEEQLLEKVQDTERELVRLSEGGTIQTYYFQGILHYSFVLVDSRILYVSAYEQFPGTGVSSPVFELDLERDTKLQRYWLAVLDQLIGGSKRSGE